jgi:hypothetical protein
MRVPDLLTKCVAFVMYLPKGKTDLQYAGTSFLVQVPLTEPGRALQYMVTAWHVIAEISRKSQDGFVYIRVNRENGEITQVKGRVADWRKHPADPFIDVAATPWQPHDFDESVQPPKATLAPMDLIPVGTNLFATSEVIATHKIGIGDDVFCIGLFSRFVGEAKNFPILRFGAVALMPDEPIPTKYFGNVEGFLIEVRSVGGLSGAPVFVYSTSPRLVGRDEIRREAVFYLLGLVHGHWETTEKKRSPRRQRSLRLKQGSDPHEEKLNVGIAVGIPAQKILEVIEHPDFLRMRREVEETGHASLTRRSVDGPDGKPKGSG